MHYTFKILALIVSFVLIPLFGSTQDVITVPIKSESSNSENIKLELMHRFQHYISHNLDQNDIYDRTVNSPKSVKVLDAKDKIYVHSLEGYSTTIYSISEFKKIKTIYHKFSKNESSLFIDTFYYDQKFKTKKSDHNFFKGKPVESCFSHNGKYLWVTYYRRSFDKNAIDPSAVCIIDTDTDKIVRVIPTGPLPKMIASSPDSKYIAISHWGDNTVAMINIESSNPKDFCYTNKFLVDQKLKLDFSNDEKVNRDQGCGACLRGTVFTNDSKFLLIGKMGGAAIAIIDVEKQEYVGSINGMMGNLRHLIINNGWLYLSINKYGYIQRTRIEKFINHLSDINKPYEDWERVYVGKGARTIEASIDGKFIFACVNEESKLVVVNTFSMTVETEIPVDSYPVGLGLTKDSKWIITTSQGKSSKGGNSVSIYKAEYY